MSINTESGCILAILASPPLLQCGKIMIFIKFFKKQAAKIIVASLQLSATIYGRFRSDAAQATGPKDYQWEDTTCTQPKV